MPERTDAERNLIFLEICHDIWKDQRDGHLPDGFMTLPLLALAVNKAKDALYPETIERKQPPKETQEVPELNRVAREFPTTGPQEQGGAPSNSESTETFEIPLNNAPGGIPHNEFIE